MSTALLARSIPTGYAPWWTKLTGHLGGIYPFQDGATPSVCSLDIGAIIQARRARGEPVTLDPVALVSKATLPYLLGNRTLLNDIRRAPWMACPDAEGRWYATPLPSHGKSRPDPSIFVKELKSALLDEARSYVQGAATVGILLSGGMDSRVLSGVVRALQEETGNAFSVIGLTWGIESSRDVIYARRITQRFSWEWKHFPISAQTLAENIGHSARMGAEFSPIHLHAMPSVARTEYLDVVLAGSYGDSVGRAEFSGRRVTKLPPVLPEHLDRFGILRSNAIAAASEFLRTDVTNTPHLDEQTPLLRRREIEQEMHYMRRMLQACMLVIAQKKPFYQLFTSPNVFGRMWSLDPVLRNDEWYRLLLSEFPGNLLDLPWARTGRRYCHPGDAPDEFLRQYHTYGSWLRGELREMLLSRANSDRIRGLGIFNERGLDGVLHAWGKAGTASTNRLDELIAWIASFHEFMVHYDIEPEAPFAESSWRDSMNALRGGFLAKLYVHARDVRERLQE